MKVLSIASEVYPLIKTGGLADVTGALPLALKTHDIEVKTLVPGYPAVMKVITKAVKRITFADLFGVEATVLEAHHQGLDILVLDAPALFDRPGGPYLDQTGMDYADNWKRFAALSRAGAEIASGRMPGWRPDLVHAHDWQAALTPLYMRYSLVPEVPSILTIHNIAFQGQFPSDIFPYLGIPGHAYLESVEYYGKISYLKGGLQTAHVITTVSPSYAEEILTADFGMGLEGVISSRVDDLYGIANGIDAQVWNPANDELLPARYTAATLKKRNPNRHALTSRFGIEDGDGPVFSVISRLTWQKGMDLLAQVIDEIVAAGGKLVILGAGDPALEGALRAAAARHKGRVGMVVGYDEKLSHLMQAGADAILVPSRFEPCGLTQLYALRYGCVPVVARTGGLNDTIIDANEAALAAGAATGIQFSPVSTDGFRHGLRRAFRLYRDTKLWTQIQRQGMKSDVSWAKSAERYADLYQSLISKGH
ncbi:MAG: glycogen synthase GlgA [Allorhizobium sp.]